MFATPSQLSLLAKAKTWYMDATFKVVKSPFTQLFSIHAFVKQDEDIKQLPLAYALMSEKRRRDYKKVLQAILDLLPQEIAIEAAVADFETALWQAMAEVMEDIPIQGCVFHWTVNKKSCILKKCYYFFYNT